MAVDDRDGIGVCNRNLVRLDSHKFAIFRMCFMNGQVAAAEATLVQIPQVGELGQERTGDVLDGPVTKIRQDEEQHRQSQQCPWCEEQGQEHVAGGPGEESTNLCCSSGFLVMNKIAIKPDEIFQCCCEEE